MINESVIFLKKEIIIDTEKTPDKKGVICIGKEHAGKKIRIIGLKEQT